MNNLFLVLVGGAIVQSVLCLALITAIKEMTPGKRRVILVNWCISAVCGLIGAFGLAGPF